MANQGYAKLINAPFTRMKLNLCPTCIHFKRAEGRDKPSDDAWDRCSVKHTMISAAKTDNGRCEDHKSDGRLRLTEAEMDIEREGVRLHREHKARRRVQS